MSEVICSIGRLHKIKSFDVLIDAFSLYVQDFPDAKLIIAGSDNGVRQELGKQIIDLNLQDSIFLIGAIEKEDKNLLLANTTQIYPEDRGTNYSIRMGKEIAEKLNKT